MQLILIKIILQAITFVTLCVSAVPVEDPLCSVAKQPPDGKYCSAVPSVCELCVSLSLPTHTYTEEGGVVFRLVTKSICQPSRLQCKNSLSPQTSFFLYV